MKCEVKSVRLVKNPESARKAYVSVMIDDSIALNDVTILEGKKGLFIAMPQKEFKDEDGETRYANIYNPITKKAHDVLINTVMSAYRSKLAE